MPKSSNEFPGQLPHHSGRMMRLDPTRLLLAFKKPHTRLQVQDLLASSPLELENSGPINHTPRRWWVRTKDGQSIGDKTVEDLQTSLETSLDWIGPVYQVDGMEGREGHLCPLPNVLVIQPTHRFKNKGLAKWFGLFQLGKWARHYRLTKKLSKECQCQEVNEKSKFSCGQYYFHLDAPFGSNVYQIAARLAEEKLLIGGVRFETMPMVSQLAYVPSDPQYKNGPNGQWNMRTIQAGSDKPADPSGWDLTTGSTNLVIWVIDKGFDTVQHPDLPYFNGFHLDLGFDLATMTPIIDLPDYDKPVDKHGIHCAGVAAATLDNDLCVAGVAGRCRIIPLAIPTESPDEVLRAFEYATEHVSDLGVDARIISCSFAFSSSYSSIVDPAIQKAFDAGMVLCAPTGNADTRVIGYPANNPFVIACGASNREDNKVSKPAYSWGSNFGAELSVMAPGVNIPTTGLLGSCHDDFNGTSAAAPHAAGLAALILSLRPDLTNVQVRDIIESTADKVGPTPYSVINPNGTWNDQMGYGRINALAALQKAKTYP